MTGDAGDAGGIPMSSCHHLLPLTASDGTKACSSPSYHDHRSSDQYGRFDALSATDEHPVSSDG